jgi:hypothetical protein
MQHHLLLKQMFNVFARFGANQFQARALFANDYALLTFSLYINVGVNSDDVFFWLKRLNDHSGGMGDFIAKLTHEFF